MARGFSLAVGVVSVVLLPGSLGRVRGGLCVGVWWRSAVAFGFTFRVVCRCVVEPVRVVVWLLGGDEDGCEWAACGQLAGAP